LSIQNVANNLITAINQYVENELKVNTIHEFCDKAKEVSQYVSVPHGTKFKDFKYYGDTLGHSSFERLQILAYGEKERNRRGRRYGYNNGYNNSVDDKPIKIDEWKRHNLSLGEVDYVFYQDNPAETKLITNRKIREFIETDGTTRNIVVLAPKTDADDVREAVENVKVF